MGRHITRKNVLSFGFLILILHFIKSCKRAKVSYYLNNYLSVTLRHDLN